MQLIEPISWKYTITHSHTHTHTHIITWTWASQIYYQMCGPHMYWVTFLLSIHSFNHSFSRPFIEIYCVVWSLANTSRRPKSTTTTTTTSTIQERRMNEDGRSEWIMKWLCKISKWRPNRLWLRSPYSTCSCLPNLIIYAKHTARKC